MLSYVQIEGLTKSFGDLVLYEKIDFDLSEGQRVAIVAKNGAGKSTLLNIIAGNDTADEGKLSFKRDLRISFLEQDPKYNFDSTVFDAFMSVENEYKNSHKESEWEYEIRAKQILTKLRIGDFDKKVSQLSGGQLKRLALANALISEPDLLILDEPTNHLDLEMVEWLEDYLNKTNMTLLMVTHDRYFLDRVCSDIVEIDQKKFYRYKGNYSYYLEKHQERVDKQNAELAKANNLYRKELDWMRRQPQARGTKAKGRVDAFYNLQEKVSVNKDEGDVRLEVKSSYLGSKIFEAKHIYKAYGDKYILKNFNYNFSRYEKLGIVGKNGTGKSTFLKLLLGIQKPDSGEFDIGETVKFGYYSQDGLSFNDQMKVIDVVRDIAEEIDLGDGRKLSASQFLQHFLFTPETQYNYVYKLSGGEKRRLYLCTVLMKSPNFLVLDEPTNDLDIMTLNVLEEYLRNFKACVIVVSHDRYFMDKLVDHLLVFKDNAEIKDFPGNYTQYRLWRDEQDKELRQQENAKESLAKTLRSVERKRRLTYAEQKEHESLTKEIENLEKEKKELESSFLNNNLTPDLLMSNSERIALIIKLLDKKEMRWLELDDLNN